LSGESEQSLHHLSAANGRFGDGLKGPARGVSLREVLHIGGRQRKDGRQHVVHVVGHASGKPPKAFKLFGLLELGVHLFPFPFSPDALRNIPHHDDQAGRLPIGVPED
jgi:hypothetical protein